MNWILKNIKIIITAAAILAAVLVFFAVFVTINITTTQNVYKAYKNNDGTVGINVNLSTLREYNIDYGDAVDVKFESGYNAQFSPVLNGDFVNAGNHILKAVNENDNVLFYIEDNFDSPTILNIENNPNVTINLREKNKYLDLYKASNLPINEDQKDLRAIKVGNLGYLDIFRGISPGVNPIISDTLNYYFNGLNINNIIELENNDNNIHQINIKNKNCNKLIIDTLIRMSSNNNRTYICSCNIDMRAYFCALLECLSDASYEQIVSDYMETYKNLYNIEKDKEPVSYNAIKKYHIDDFLHRLTKTPEDYDMTNLDFSHAAEMYLRANGQNDDTVNLIKSRFTKKY